MKVCPHCNLELTQSDDHIFDGADFIAWWCEACDIEVERISINPNDYQWNPILIYTPLEFGW